MEFSGYRDRAVPAHGPAGVGGVSDWLYIKRGRYATGLSSCSSARPYCRTRVTSLTLAKY